MNAWLAWLLRWAASLGIPPSEILNEPEDET